MPKAVRKQHITLTFTEDELALIEKFRLSFDSSAFRNEALMEAVRRCLGNGVSIEPVRVVEADDAPY